MDIQQAVVFAAIGVATGACACWWLVGSYYTHEPSARENELWKRIAELQALLKVPPLFWHVWARYTDELTHSATRGKHAADNETHERDTPPDRPRLGDDRDTRP